MKKRIIVAVVAALLCASASMAQFKTQVDQGPIVSDGVSSQTTGSFLFSWFDPENFHMRHSFDLSYQTFGGQGMSLGTYTNSMTYDFSDKLNARADVSMSYSPYNTFSTFGGKKNDLSKIYLSRAEVNYKPWENVMVKFQYRQMPYGSYYYSPFYSPWYREDGF
jgi:opacity protein-like surface antigen